MKYIAALDYDHLDNSIFLTALARAISRQQDTQPIIVHGDSEYTERVMQTGVMRDEARIRSIKDLNHRLIALLADEGVSTVGINGYQRELITRKDDQLFVDESFFDGLPEGPALLVSTLVWDMDDERIHPIALDQMVAFLQKAFGIDTIYAFSSADNDEIIITEKPETLAWNNLPEDFAEQNLPTEFQAFNKPLHLCKTQHFESVGQNREGILIE